MHSLILFLKNLPLLLIVLQVLSNPTNYNSDEILKHLLTENGIILCIRNDVKFSFLFDFALPNTLLLLLYVFKVGNHCPLEMLKTQVVFPRSLGSIS